MNAIAPPRRHPPRMRASAPVTFATLLAVVSLIAALAQGLVAAQPSQAASPEDFLDVRFDHVYYEAAEGLYQAGVADGYPVAGGKEFRPGNPLWRAQFTKMILGALAVPVTENAWNDATPPFTDLEADVADDLYPHDYVAEAAHRGITYGTGPTKFSPYVNISRGQLITMAARAARVMKPRALTDPPAGYAGSLPGFVSPDHAANLRLAEYSGLLAGLVGFGPAWNPWHDATRGEAAQIMWNLYRVTGGPSPGLLYVDDFSDPASGWSDTLLANSSVGYFEGRYAITLLKPGVSTWSARDMLLSDATTEIDATPAPGQGETEYGMKFRLQGSGNCYQLTLGSDGSAGLWKVIGEGREALIPEKAFPAVKKTGINHLTITLHGDMLTIWINNVLLGTLTEDTFPSGLFALHATSFDEGGVTVYFDNFRVWSNGPEAAEK